MAFTQADLTKLEKAIATGAKTVMQGGEMITFDSLDAMIARRNMIKGELGIGTKQPTRKVHYPHTKSGFRA